MARQPRLVEAKARGITHWFTTKLTHRANVLSQPKALCAILQSPRNIANNCLIVVSRYPSKGHRSNQLACASAGSSGVLCQQLALGPSGSGQHAMSDSPRAKSALHLLADKLAKIADSSG